tara:strand:+ start:50 stop:529 length:480 start_codon:yes stop_codon:yes gene_type:complete
MNLEQIKKHFKNAKEVRCPYDNEIFNIDVEGEFKEECGDIYFSFDIYQKKVCEVYLWYQMDVAEIISYKDIPEQEPEKSEYPKVMLVSDDESSWEQRVVFMEKQKIFLAWLEAKTIEEAKIETAIARWKYAKELPKEIEVTKEEIAKWKGCEVEQLIIK